MKNDPDDRHFLAVAVSSHSELIVTYNRRHFPAASVEAWEMSSFRAHPPSCVSVRAVYHDAGSIDRGLTKSGEVSFLSAAAVILLQIQRENGRIHGSPSPVTLISIELGRVPFQ